MEGIAQPGQTQTQAHPFCNRWYAYESMPRPLIHSELILSSVGAGHRETFRTLLQQLDHQTKHYSGFLLVYTPPVSVCCYSRLHCKARLWDRLRKAFMSANVTSPSTYVGISLQCLLSLQASTQVLVQRPVGEC